MESKLGR